MCEAVAQNRKVGCKNVQSLKSGQEQRRMGRYSFNFYFKGILWLFSIQGPFTYRKLNKEH